MGYRKENHLEFSDGDTAFISIKGCPLTDNEVEEDISILSHNGVVCCTNSDEEYTCPHFYGYLSVDTDDGSVSRIQCSKLSPIKLGEGSPTQMSLPIVGTS